MLSLGWMFVMGMCTLQGYRGMPYLTKAHTHHWREKIIVFYWSFLTSRSQLGRQLGSQIWDEQNLLYSPSSCSTVLLFKSGLMQTIILYHMLFIHRKNITSSKKHTTHSFNWLKRYLRWDGGDPHTQHPLLWVGAKRHVHWFLGGKSLDIQQWASVWVGSPKSDPVRPFLESILSKYCKLNSYGLLAHYHQRKLWKDVQNI